MNLNIGILARFVDISISYNKETISFPEIQLSPGGSYSNSGFTIN
jgi:hypothetical protein